MIPQIRPDVKLSDEVELLMLRNEAEKAKHRGDRQGYWDARRAYFLLQGKLNSGRWDKREGATDD